MFVATVTELRLFGQLGLYDAAGVPATELCARPKTVALLVYLVLARPLGYQAQDALLAMFWPESDTARAQLSLRQSLHLLRRFLGEGIVNRRGRAEIGVATAELRCDVVEFDRAVEAGALNQALAAYEGELLPGFYIPDAPEFERWLNAERSRLRESAIETARTLTLRFRDSGDARASADCARRWSAIAVDDVDALHHTIVALTDIGDHSAALRTYDDFVLSRTLDDATVNTETEQLVATTRAVLAHNVANFPVALSSPSTQSPSNTPVPTRSMSASRRLGAAVAIAATLLVAVTSVGLLSLRAWSVRSMAARSSSKSSRIAVMPFAIHGGARLEYLREGMVELLSVKLDGVGALSTVDPQVLLADHAASAVASLTPKAARDIAERLSADQFVLGSVVDVGGRIEIAATLYALDGTKRLSISRAAIDEAHVLSAIDGVARALVGEQFADAPERLERVATTTTSSLPALKSFLEGEQAFRLGQLASSVDAFKRAILEDSTFALAYYRLSTAADWSTDSAAIRAAIAASERFTARLPQHERLVLAARSAVKNGAAEEAEQQYRAIVVTYPDDADAWNQLGELRFHTGPWRGIPLTESRDAFERVLVLHPTDVSAMLHLARLAALEQRGADVDSLVRLALGLNPEREVTLELRGLRGALRADTLAERALLDTLRATSRLGDADDVVRLVANRVATFTDQPRTGTAFMWAFGDARDARRLPMAAHLILAHMAAARGKWRTAYDELNVVAREDAPLAAEVRANFSLSRPDLLSSSARARSREILGRPVVASARDPMRLARRGYLAGILALEDHDAPAVALQIAMLAKRGAGHDAEAEFARHLSHELTARVLREGGEVSAALEEVERGWPHGTPSASLPLFQGEAFAPSHERLFRAELLLSLGQDAEASRWLRSVPEDQGAGLFLSASVHVALGHIAERRGDPAGARREYQSALVLWYDADSEMRGTVDSTVAALARVGRIAAPRRTGGDPAGK